MTHKNEALTPLTSMRPISSIFCLVFASVALGCSGQTFTVGGFDDAGMSPPDGGAGTSDDGGASGVIDPIAVGNTWTYDVTVAGTYPACTNGSGTSSVTQEKTLDGKDAFSVSSFCASLGSFWYSTDGDRVYQYDDASSTWLLALESPVEDGRTWSNGTSTFVWKKIGSLAVKAGTYDDCWEVDLQGGAQFYAVTFCRGIGPVKWHVRDSSSLNGYDAALTQKNF
ncbi:MAG: hypothetical protein ABI551_12545 [Polyangiaceae bacterium]